jgi:hypothetical protein
MDKVYYTGDLIPEKDWDYENKRPKIKATKVKKEEVSVELTPEVIEDLVKD